MIAEARRRAGLTQAELAAVLGTSQPAVARWETGRHSPSLDAVLRAVRACGFDLHVSMSARDDDHARLLDEYLRMSPAERLSALQDQVFADAKLRGAALR